MLEKPKFIQGLFPFKGSGLATPTPLEPSMTYTVPTDKRSQLIYFRAGNSLNELVYLVIHRDDAPMRYFPIGAKDAIHISLAVVEDLHPGTQIEVRLAAPDGAKGHLVLDLGFMEF